MNQSKLIKESNKLSGKVTELEDRIKMLENDMMVCKNICTALNKQIKEKLVFYK